MINFSKSINIFYFVGLLLLTGCAENTNSVANTTDEKEKLLGAIEKFNTAFANGDTETLASMITNNYVHTNSSAKSIHKKDWLAYLQKRKGQLASGALVVDNYKMEETEIELYDDMAIVTGKISFSSTRSGEQKDNEIRITNVWVKENDNWKRAGFHDTRIK